MSLPIEVHAGRTPEIIHLAHSCLAVSGSVSLELLYRCKPSVVLYRHHAISIVLAHLLKRVPYITLVNLLANKELFPEFFGVSCPAETMAAHILHWLNDRAAYESLCGELATLRDRVAEPGAANAPLRRCWHWFAANATAIGRWPPKNHHPFSRRARVSMRSRHSLRALA